MDRGSRPRDRGKTEFVEEAQVSRDQTHTEDLDAARQRVRRGGRRLLLRLYRANLMDEDAVRLACGEIGIGPMPEDF